MSKQYAVIFDNDEEFPGVTQFCNVASEEEFLEGSGTNVTEDYAYAVQFVVDSKEAYPSLNYRVVEVSVREIV